MKGSSDKLCGPSFRQGKAISIVEGPSFMF